MQITCRQKRVCKDFKIKNLGKYHNLYVQRDTLLLTHVFNNSWNMSFKIYGLDPTHFLSSSRLVWQASLKKPIMVEKGVRCRMCHATHLYVKANNKYMKDYDKNKESSYLKYWDLNSLYGWAMPQKRSVDDFRWVENKSQFNEDFI